MPKKEKKTVTKCSTIRNARNCVTNFIQMYLYSVNKYKITNV